MKKVIIIILVIIVIAVGGIVAFQKKSKANDDILRIHIRANSNLEVDQNAKYDVRDSVINYIILLIENAKTKAEVQEIISANKNNITAIADNVLKAKGMEYGSNLKLTREYFPTRKYADKEFKAGEYDCLILNLGSGEGDNWWCVAYPPLCFVPSSENGQNRIMYSSKIAELIKGGR